MKYYVAFDGGGSKIEAILFDEELNLISHARSGSMNTSSSDPELVNKNADDCARALFEGTGVTEIESVYGTFTRRLSDALGKYVKVNSVTDAGGEALIGLLAAFIPGDAVTVLSGTGSVIFCSYNGQYYEAGGFGSVIHDEGSGYHMGRMAFAEAIKEYEHRGPHTLITDCMCEKFGAKDIGEVAQRMYDTPGKSPVSAVASVATCVGEAARRGDEIAKKLLCDIGRNLGEQAMGLINRRNIPVEIPVVMEGGHFKNHRLIGDTLTEYIHSFQPERKVIAPYFEPIVGAVLAHPYFKGEFPGEEKLEEMKKQYADFRYKMNGEN